MTFRFPSCVATPAACAPRLYLWERRHAERPDTGLPLMCSPCGIAACGGGFLRSGIVSGDHPMRRSAMSPHLVGAPPGARRGPARQPGGARCVHVGRGRPAELLERFRVWLDDGAEGAQREPSNPAAAGGTRRDRGRLATSDGPAPTPCDPDLPQAGAPRPVSSEVAGAVGTPRRPDDRAATCPHSLQESRKLWDCALNPTKWKTASGASSAGCASWGCCWWDAERWSHGKKATP